jgi:hypothetical protein
MKQPRKKRILIYAATVLALGIATIIYLAERPKLVLQTARLFCVVPPWTGQQLAPSFNHFYWLANNAALIVPGSGPNAPSGLYRVTSDPAGRAGTPVPFVFPPTSMAGDDISVSPDGRYLACLVVVKSGTSPFQLVVRQMDGNTLVHRDWKMDVPNNIGEFAWDPDSQSLLTLQFRPEPWLMRFFIHTGRRQQVPLPPGLPLSDLGNSSILGFTERATLIIARAGPSFQDRAFSGAFGTSSGITTNIPRIPLIEISLSQCPKIVRTFAPAVPSGAGIGIIALSPRGDRLFWSALCANRPSPLQVRLHRYFSFVPGDTTVVEKGWVSRLDGSGMKELGYYEIPPGTPGVANPAGPPWIIDPKWTPDGKRIGFVYKDRLMTIPAE